ncbi:MAG: endopeptidase La [Holosporales bacterium]|jgi:ATP-dependent Lon protease|nr:endopeptidase La [Holosporales bacterium]
MAEKVDSKRNIPVLVLRDTVIFPSMVVPLFVGRAKSVAAVKAAWERKNRDLVLLTQKHPSENEPKLSDVYTVGTIGAVRQILELSDGTVKILVSGESRVRATGLRNTAGYVSTSVEELPDFVSNANEAEVLHKIILKEFESFAKVNSKFAQEFHTMLSKVENSSEFVNMIMSGLAINVQEKQAMLENQDLVERLEDVLTLLRAENEVYSVEKRIHGRVKKQIEKTQREYYLNEQIRAINRELGKTEDPEDEYRTLEKRIEQTKFSKEARERAMARLSRLRSMNPMSAEHTVIRTYLDWLLDIPWNKKTKIKKDITAAETVLERDHYALKNVKDRILEYLAVQLRVDRLPGQILCFVGPPGVGKTSLGKSIAEATGRAFVRVSLGGVSDEAEIRGHRSTYIGAMPGKIIQGMKKAKHSNPLFLLDEVDKLGHDWRGDPASALLEVLDPEQNSAFNDNYIEVDYDLSEVMFVATANTLNMPQALLDRMELIRIPGYTEDEKFHIAVKHIVPKQMQAHGLKKSEFCIKPESIINLIRAYTKEAGVRNLEREIATLSRKAVREIVTNHVASITINQEYIQKFCGAPKYNFSKSELFKEPGISTGLAWTEVGGDIIFIEVLILSGKGQIIQTGKLGDVMKESIQASVSYIRSMSANWNIEQDFFEKHDIHVHVPEGATPKDGPSAGTAICTALTSALTKTVVRHDVAMTGEINLRGQVLEIGGLKEKLLAAHRGGIKTVIIPKENEKDLAEIDEKIKNDLTFVMASSLDEVLHHALTHPEQIGL